MYYQYFSFTASYLRLVACSVKGRDSFLSHAVSQCDDTCLAFTTVVSRGQTLCRTEVKGCGHGRSATCCPGI